MNKTFAYYEKNARNFIEETIDADMRELHQAFLRRIPAGGHILDLGCGSGRDGRAFMAAGYTVAFVDASQEMCKAVKVLTGQTCACSTFADYMPQERFDGIWACASLLHLRQADVRGIIEKFLKFLLPGGCFYMSFKYGNFSGERDGRFFTDLTEESLRDILFGIEGMKTVETRVTADVRCGRSERKWLNVYLVRAGKSVD